MREGGRGVLRTALAGRRWLVWALAIFLIVPLALGVYLRHVVAFDGPQQFWEQKGELVEVREATAEGDSLYRAYELSLVSSAGYHVDGFLRVPRAPGRWPALVLLGGVRTGKMSAQLVTPESPYVILGLDYPWEGDTKLTASEFLLRIFEVREAMLLTPSAVFLALDYLESREDVDAERITLTGASFGAQLMAVVGALDSRAGPVILCYGGGDYALLLDGSLKVKPRFVRSLLAVAGAWLVEPLEPLDYVADIAPDPVVIINGLDDDRIPPESVYLLYERAQHPKRLIWLEEGHISSRNPELLKRVIDAAVLALADLDDASAGTSD